MALLSDQGAEFLIPVCAVVGIVFSLVQWFLISKVKLLATTAGIVLALAASASSKGKNGYTEYLIEEEGVADQDVVVKCAEIQNAISEGATSFLFTDHS